MNIAVDVLLLVKDGIIPGDEEQKAKANQPDRPCNNLEESSYMFAGVKALEAIPRVQIDIFLIRVDSPDSCSSIIRSFRLFRRFRNL